MRKLGFLIDMDGVIYSNRSRLLALNVWVLNFSRTLNPNPSGSGMLESNSSNAYGAIGFLRHGRAKRIAVSEDHSILKSKASIDHQSYPGQAKNSSRPDLAVPW